jgi:hypothetical protein
MNDTNPQPLEGEVLDTLPAHVANPQPGTAIALPANPYFGLIEKLLDKGTDLQRLDQLLDLQMKWEANEARKAFVAAMAAFKAEPIVIEKAKHVSYKNKSGGLTEYDHAELADITQKVVPAMAKHGLSHRWTFRQDSSRGITVGCVITHRLGHVDEAVEMTAPPDDSGGKNTIQSIASTKTYLERYTLLAATGVATGGEIDDDGRGGGDGTGDAEWEAAMQSWRDGIDAAIDHFGLKAVKAEMATAFGGQMQIPKELVRYYNARWDELTKAQPESSQS